MTFIETIPEEQASGVLAELYAEDRAATLAAARRLRSSYCMLAHGSVVLSNEILGADELRAVALDHRSAGLDPADVAVMDLADKVVDDAAGITQEDIDAVRGAGLSDAEILDATTNTRSGSSPACARR